MKTSLRASVPLLICVIPLAGCVTPRVVHVYDEKCQLMTRRVDLSIEKARELEACLRYDCAANVLGVALAFTATAVVSGSVALVGNTAFWLQKTANCKSSPAASESTTQVQSAPSASAAKP